MGEGTAIRTWPAANANVANGYGWYPYDAGGAGGGWCSQCYAYVTYPHSHFVFSYPVTTHSHDWQVVTFNGLGYVACKGCTVVTRLP